MWEPWGSLQNTVCLYTFDLEEREREGVRERQGVRERERVRGRGGVRERGREGE